MECVSPMPQCGGMALLALPTLAGSPVKQGLHVQIRTAELVTGTVVVCSPTTPCPGDRPWIDQPIGKTVRFLLLGISLYGFIHHLLQNDMPQQQLLPNITAMAFASYEAVRGRKSATTIHQAAPVGNSCLLTVLVVPGIAHGSLELSSTLLELALTKCSALRHTLGPAGELHHCGSREDPREPSGVRRALECHSTSSSKVQHCTGWLIRLC